MRTPWEKVATIKVTHIPDTGEHVGFSVYVLP